MAELQKQTLEAESIPQEKIPQQIANIQNNFNFAQNLDIDKLAYLSKTDKKLADRVMTLYEKNFEHVRKCDVKVITLEEQEQKLRAEETPYQRKFVFRALTASWSISVLGLVVASIAMYFHYPVVAGIAISIPVGVVAVNMLGIKNNNQK